MTRTRSTRREWLTGTAVAVVLGAGPVTGSVAHGQADAETIPITGRAMPRLKRFDSVMLGLIEKHRFPAASLAMAREGRLVFARGYGFAELKGRTTVRPAMQFGIGSVSKTITAVAVLKLVEAGKLRLDDRAFAILGDLKPVEGAKVDPRRDRITVRMLLNHSSGYENGVQLAEAAKAFGIGRDDLTAAQLVRYSLGRPLEYDPGTQARYSNAGYVVLGEIVAHLGGRPYEEYVTRQVLAPMGIRHAALGTRSKTYPADWVHRYDHQGKELDPLPPAAGGAAGFWVTSTVELIRFLTSVGGSRGPRFFSPSTRQEMFAPPPPPLQPRANGKHFGLGWDTVEHTPQGPVYTKNGGVPGYRAFIGHLRGDVDWAFLATDASGDQGENSEAAAAITREIERTNIWPEVDLFDQFR
jgi:CubicO group peptidase (beta-lactamase class C family)